MSVRYAILEILQQYSTGHQAGWNQIITSVSVASRYFN